MTDPLSMEAAELLDAYRAGDTTPVEVLAAVRARIAAVNPVLNSVITVIGDRAAEESTRRWRAGAPRALEGVPFGVKDVIDVEGVPTTGGSKIYDGRIAQRSAEVVRRAEEAGAIAVTKDATTEFAIGGPHNPAFGPVRNPWDTSRWTGGSSTGSAASVAARCYPLAIGTDAGGSIRIPSAWCGLTGLKPTSGAVSRTGGVPMSWVTETVGPLGRSARCRAVLRGVARSRSRGSEIGATAGIIAASRGRGPDCGWACR